MNNCIDRNYNSLARTDKRVYNECFGEKVITFFCLIIAFFENGIVDLVCRTACGIAIVIGSFFYVSGLMSGALSAVGIFVYGVLLIAASAFAFRSKAVR